MTREPGDLAGALPMIRAHVEGRKAARDGLRLTACPYDPNAADVFERVKARMWLRGYDRERPAPIDYDG